MKSILTSLLITWSLWLSASAYAQPARPSVSVTGSVPLTPGASAQLSAPGGYSYTWTRNNVDEVGTQQTITVTTAGYYRVRVSDGTGSATSDPVRITLRPGSGNADKNFVQEDYVKTAGVQTEAAVDASSTKKNRTVAYSDGLGRIVQTVQVGATPLGNDLILPIEYNAAGQAGKAYLPYATSSGTTPGAFRSNYEAEQRNFYANADKVVREPNGRTYAESTFEDVPGGGVIEQGAPGTDWQIARDANGRSTFQGHTGRSVLRTNEANEVPVWAYIPAVDGSIGSATYTWSSAQTLRVQESRDPDNKASAVYSDLQGRVVSKRTDLGNGQYAYTCSVYDNAGRLLMELSAEGVKRAIQDGEQPTVTFLEKWGYFYQYDSRGRLVGRKTPGRQWAYRLYDPWDRVVATQNGNQRQESKWRFFKYDELNRHIASGIVVDGRSRQQLAADIVSAVASGTLQRYELRTTPASSGLRLGYTLSRTFPTNVTGSDLLRVNYYDSYDFLGNNIGGLGYEVEANATQVIHPNQPSLATQGVATGSQVRNLENSQVWYTSIVYYDDEERPIQLKSENHLGGIDRITTEYNYAGQVLKTLTTHAISGGTPYTIRYRYTYKDNGDLNETFGWFNQATVGTTELLLSRKERNELGQLVDQKLGRVDVANNRFLQSLDYRYNLRGGLDKINNRNLSGVHYDPRKYTVTGQTEWLGPHTPNEDSDAYADYFGLELEYEGDHTGSVAGNYNGNISTVLWNTRSPKGKLRAYRYEYDANNQMTAAKYASYGYNPATAQWGWHQEQSTLNNKGWFTTDGVTYDLNGNIRSLSRNGHRSGSADAPVFGAIDQLTYTYDGNKLLSVEDAAGSSVAPNDFEDGAHSATEYEYDANGNVTVDRNKGITVAYNALNLPREIRFANGDVQRFTYSAAGQKLTHQIQSATGTRTVDYAGGVVYGQGPYPFVATPVGRAFYDKTRTQSDRWVQEYHLRDHLGSLRIALRGGSTTVVNASMEASNSAREEAAFANIAETRQLDAEHARTGYYAARLNAGQAQRLHGPSTSLPVHAGDSIRVEAFGRYDKALTGGALPALLPVGISSNSRPAGDVMSAKRNLLSRLGAGITLAWAVLPHFRHAPERLPLASLKYEFYNRDSVLVSSGVKYLDETSANDWQRLAMGFTAEQDGYVRMALENASAQNVWFDDAQIVAQEDLVVQENHYDPFGQNLVSIEQIGTPDYARQYTDKERINESNLEWVDYGARYYDPQLGRWHSPDPLEQYASPYVAMGNNPVNSVDPDGRWVHIVAGAAIGGVINVALHWRQISTSENPLKDGAIAFGIGAVAGGVTAATGGAAAGAASTLLGGAAATGGTAVAIAAGAGAAGGVAGAALGAPIQGLGNKAYFGDEYSLKQYGREVLIGGALGAAGGAGGQLFKNWKGNGFRFRAGKPGTPADGGLSNKAESAAEGIDDAVDAASDAAGKTTVTGGGIHHTSGSVDAEGNIIKPITGKLDEIVVTGEQAIEEGAGAYNEAGQLLIKRSVGAAARSAQNVKFINDAYVKKAGIDAHELKKAWLGNSAKISEYDLYKHTDTGEILIFRKGGIGDPIFTGEFID